MMGENNKGRIGNLEREMEEVKLKLERLTEMEKKMESLTQGVAQIYSALEETNRSILSMGKSNPAILPQEKILTEDKPQSKGKKSQNGLQGKEPDYPLVMLPPIEVIFSDDSNSKNREKGRLMKLKGRIKHKEVVVLIKGGATHNFISTKLVKELKLPQTLTRDYKIDFCAGKERTGESICMAVTLEMPGLTIVEDFVPLQLLDNVDVILGMKWLCTLGMVEHNFKPPCRMKFMSGNHLIYWTADADL